jgi:hypothetical protein
VIAAGQIVQRVRERSVARPPPVRLSRTRVRTGTHGSGEIPAGSPSLYGMVTASWADTDGKVRRPRLEIKRRVEELEPTQSLGLGFRITCSVAGSEGRSTRPDYPCRRKASQRSSAFFLLTANGIYPRLLIITEERMIIQSAEGDHKECRQLLSEGPSGRSSRAGLQASPVPMNPARRRTESDRPRLTDRRQPGRRVRQGRGRGGRRASADFQQSLDVGEHFGRVGPFEPARVAAEVGPAAQLGRRRRVVVLVADDQREQGGIDNPGHRGPFPRPPDRGRRPIRSGRPAVGRTGAGGRAGRAAVAAGAGPRPARSRSGARGRGGRSDA